MIRPAILAAASTISLTACAGSAAAAPPNAAFLAAHLLADDVAAASATKLLPVFAEVKRARPAVRHGVARPSITGRVEAAKRAAVQEPDPDAYVGAVQVYPWAEGALYQLYTAPEQVSDIALQPGESLVSVAAGDTARWVIGDTASGTGGRRRTHVLVKPSTIGLRTNLVIATDRRVYHIELESTPKAAMASIAWTYSGDSLLALSGAAAVPDSQVAAGVAVDALNFNYRIEGDRPAWRPLRAFDDGRQVFIEFPPTLAQEEAPPLFVTGDGGRAELVNYRLRGRYYVVDRLFSAAELRLGERRQQVVRIVREDPSHRRGS
jgi:type IV secretion system protein VirB9